MTTPPTRPEPWDPRNYPEPLDVADQEEARWRFFHPEDEEPLSDRRSCLSVIGFLVLFWAALAKIAGWWTL